MKYEALVLIADGEPDSHDERILAANVTFAEHCLVYHNFDPCTVVGKATLIMKNGRLYAAIESDFNLTGKFPAIDATYEGLTKRPDDTFDASLAIQMIGACDSPNVDTRIPPIGGEEHGN